MRILSVDIGGSNIKTLLDDESPEDKRKIPSGPDFTPRDMVSAIDEKDRMAVASAASNSLMIDRRERRKALGKQRAELTRAKRNEQKKKSRLLDKAQRLSNNDLLEVFAMRVKRNEAKAAISAAQASTGAQP